MIKQKHILLLSPGFPEDDHDTTCIPAIQDFLESFVITYPNIKVTLVSFQYPSNKEYQWKGVDVIAIGGNNKRGLTRLMNWKKGKRAIREINRKQKIDLIHSFWMTEAAYIGQQIKKELSVPHLVTIMGQDAVSKKYWSKVTPNELIALSRFHADKIAKHQCRTAHIIPWGVKDFGIEQTVKSIDVIGVGSLIDVKEWMKFLAIIEVYCQSTKLNCVIIGEGERRDDLFAEIEKRQLPVKLLGQRDRLETLNFIAQSKVLLHTSKFESFGMVLAEALQVQTQVISTPVGIAGETPTIRTFQDIDQGVAELSRCLNSEFESTSTFNFDIISVVESYYQIYSGYFK